MGATLRQDSNVELTFPKQIPIWATGHTAHCCVKLSNSSATGLLELPPQTPACCINIAIFKCVPWLEKCWGSLLSQREAERAGKGVRAKSLRWESVPFFKKTSKGFRTGESRAQIRILGSSLFSKHIGWVRML